MLGEGQQQAEGHRKQLPRGKKAAKGHQPGGDAGRSVRPSQVPRPLKLGRAGPQLPLGSGEEQNLHYEVGKERPSRSQEAKTGLSFSLPVPADCHLLPRREACETLDSILPTERRAPAPPTRLGLPTTDRVTKGAIKEVYFSLQRLAILAQWRLT